MMKTFEELDKYFETRINNRCFVRKIWEDCFYYPVYRFFIKIFDFPREVKYFCQRGKRGYSKRDVWNLGNYVLELLRTGVVDLRQNHYGHPSNLTNEKWVAILEKMEIGFDAGLKICDGMEEVLDEKGKFCSYRNYTDVEQKDFLIKYRLAMDLLKKHIFCMWD